MCPARKVPFLGSEPQLGQQHRDWIPGPTQPGPRLQHHMRWGGACLPPRRQCIDQLCPKAGGLRAQCQPSHVAPAFVLMPW